MKLVSRSILLLTALLSAQLNFINDCDETFNYWEPLHYLHFGTGFMTWEYDPSYAIRSWTYMMFFYLISLPFVRDHSSFFLRFRSQLGLLHFLSISNFISVCKNAFHKDLEFILIIIFVFSPGIFISSTSFLPSSVCMHLLALCYSLLCQGYRKSCLFTIVIMSVFCWPFCGIFVIMPFLDLLFHRFHYLNSYIIAGIWQSLLAVSISVLVDYYFYQKLVLVAWNIVSYNIFSDLGPELYGTEPLLYYIKVLMLHWGPLCLLMPLGVLLSFYSRHPMRIISSCSVIIWLLIFFSQPHKEERFLYPIYPLLTLEASHALLFVKSKVSRVLYFFVISAFVVFSVLRLTALLPRNNISHLFRSVPSGSTICLKDEWHLYPSSFNIPTDTQVRFIKGEFKGQLPYTFQQNAMDNSISNKWQASSVKMTQVNDGNKQEMNRYSNISSCDYSLNILSTSIGDNICVVAISQDEPLIGRVLRVPYSKFKSSSYYCLTALKSK
eukprot:NODE_535_length_7046_cov_0.230747.p2 type:complete len:495 gc:universal NODE_535_length_7046_cov_0.230747:2526-1042(-)